MGLLIAKLMSTFGNQGKGRTVHSSDRFDPAPTWGSPSLGSGRMRWGTSGSEVLRGHFLQIPRSRLPPPPSRSSRVVR